MIDTAFHQELRQSVRSICKSTPMPIGVSWMREERIRKTS